MPRDHFVAQTYLKHWCRPNTNQLRGYSKVADKEFQCSPKDVCHEWDWDFNPVFEENPDLLAQFKKIFEPQWNPAIHAVRAATLSSEEKFALAGYWAQLTMCTPAWHRNVVEMYEQRLLDFFPFLVQHGKLDREDQELFEDVARERARQDADEIKAVLTRHLMGLTLLLYRHDWTILENLTEIQFVTSDNPSSVFPRRRSNPRLTRFLPLAPDLAVVVLMDLSKRGNGGPPDLSKPPPGTFLRLRIDRKKAMQLNRITAMNADEMILASREERRIRRLVRNHRRFGIAVARAEIPTARGTISASTIAVQQRPKKTQPSRSG